MKTIDIEDKTSLEDLLDQIGKEVEGQEDDISEDYEPEEDIDAAGPEETGEEYTDGGEDIDLDALLSGSGVSPKALEAVKKQLEEQRVANNVLEDKLLRTQADFENFKRRTREDTLAKIRRSKTNLLKELLSLSDNFARAIKAAGEDGSFENLLEGMNTLNRLLGDVLAKENVEEIQSVGTQFDPELHDCVLAVSDPEAPKETVIEEVEKGYIMGDTVLRPAKVIVSSGAPEEE
ncbi:MAG: nucleotide exchange factor GrpE [Abditibacteriota bacterium]|nr:nucleotide exchange factor GrpE [Abditibacteriota bacterium]